MSNNSPLPINLLSSQDWISSQFWKTMTLHIIKKSRNCFHALSTSRSKRRLNPPFQEANVRRLTSPYNRLSLHPSLPNEFRVSSICSSFVLPVTSFKYSIRYSCLFTASYPFSGVSTGGRAASGTRSVPPRSCVRCAWHRRSRLRANRRLRR